MEKKQKLHEIFLTQCKTEGKEYVVVELPLCAIESRERKRELIFILKAYIYQVATITATVKNVNHSTRTKMNNQPEGKRQ